MNKILNRKYFSYCFSKETYKIQT